jgi:subtilisin family serine protease
MLHGLSTACCCTALQFTSLRSRLANVQVSMSLGSSETSSVIQQAFEELYASRNDVLYVAASGNSGRSESNYPASYQGVISVGATDALGQVAGFTTTGPTLDVLAPGHRVLSTIPLALTPENTYYTRCGS